MVPAATAAPQMSLRFVRRRSLTLVSFDFVVGMVASYPRRFAPNLYVPAGMRGGISRPHCRRHGQTIRNRWAAVPPIEYAITPQPLMSTVLSASSMATQFSPSEKRFSAVVRSQTQLKTAQK